jgi:hypothetical protein
MHGLYSTLSQTPKSGEMYNKFDDFSEDNIVMNINNCHHKMFPNFSRNFVSKNKNYAQESERYREYTEFKNQRGNSGDLGMNQTSVSKAQSYKTGAKHQNVRNILRSKKGLQGNPQNAVDLVRYVIPQLQFRGVPVFTNMDQVDSDSILNKKREFLKENISRMLQNNDFEMPICPKGGPYGYNIAEENQINSILQNPEKVNE